MRGSGWKVHGKLNPLLNYLFCSTTTKLPVMALEWLLVSRASHREKQMNGVMGQTKLEPSGSSASICPFM